MCHFAKFYMYKPITVVNFTSNTNGMMCNKNFINFVWW